MTVVECQDVARLEEPGFEDEDVDSLKTSLLVEGVVGAGPAEGCAYQEFGEGGMVGHA